MDKRKKYFIKQKLMGLGVIILGVLTAIILDGDITVALFLVPLGLTVMFTKDMVLLDRHYFEEVDKFEDEEEL